MDNEILSQEDARIQLFLQLMERVLKKLERFSQNTKPVLGGDQYLSSEEVCRLLHISPRTLQEYRTDGVLPYYKLAGRSKAIYKASDIEKVLEKHYYKSRD